MNNMLKKIGIMGGTFDPPHLGHLISAENVRIGLNLDKIIFIPTGNIYYKDTKETADVKDRLKMVELAVMDKPFFEVSDIEVRTKGYSYTFETLEKLNALYPDSEFYFIVGADSLDYMEKWKKPEKIFALSKIVAVGREGFSKKENEDKKKKLKALYNADIILFNMENVNVSSTEIRNAVKNGIDFKEKVEEAVYYYIIDNNLYKNGDTNDGN